MPTHSNAETPPAGHPERRPHHLRVPDLGCGAGLRVPHYRHVLDHEPAMGFFEVISENFFGRGGKPLYHLDRFKERYPIILHGVSLDIGGPDEPDRDYLNRLQALVRRVKPAWVSDHFCWCGAGGAHLHDLLPLPYTEQAVTRLAKRARIVQDFLEVPFGLENTSSYLTYTSSQMSEWEFVSRVAEEADCGLMFDVNNVYVSAYNHGFDPRDYLRDLPFERILQVHVAGHSNYGSHIIDTHVGPAIEPVLDIYRETIRRAGPISTVLEWDDDIPAFSELAREVERIAGARQDGLSATKTFLQRDVVSRRAKKPSVAGRAWTQGGSTENPSAWNFEPAVDALPAELALPPELDQ